LNEFSTIEFIIERFIFKGERVLLKSIIIDERVENGQFDVIAAVVHGKDQESILKR
jgi:hypothetical protein